MILAHHMGEDLIPTLIAGGGSAVPVLLFVMRVQLSRVARTFRRQRSG
jgi:hypothetical protein